MKYTPQQYAVALYAVLKGKSQTGRKEALKRFLLLLQKQRITFKLPQILREVEKQYLKEKGMQKVEVEVAASKKNLKQEIEKILGSKILFEEKENPELLAGIKILINDEVLVDASAKRGLELLF